MADEFKRDANRAPFDPYNFSEIEKIQLDIERDLHAHAPIDTFDADNTMAAINTSNTIQPFYVSDALEAEVPSFPLPDHLRQEDLRSPIDYIEDTFSYDNALIPYPHATETTDNFYTETIKQKPLSLTQRLRPYRRLTAALLLICTLGTGFLGIGIGFGIVFMQQQAGMHGHVLGNNPDGDAVTQTIGGTRLIFGNEDATTFREGSLADVVQLIDPAVVSITTVSQSQAVNPFFGSNGLQYRGGSGIIFAKDVERVFIVTNNHVLQGAREVHISIMEQDPIRANLVGRNASENLAVISVPIADIHRAGIREVSIAIFGDSDSMQVGDVVLAIGNAMGEGNSTTSGIISAGEKEVDFMGRTMRVLQTDAAINPGSSGGPLVNKDGQVIGINTWLATSEQYVVEGMGFSIPSNVAKPIIEEIMNATPRPFLGIQGLDINEELAAQFNIPPIGIYIENVIEGTSADLAGLRRGDIITSFNGRAVFNMEMLVEEIGRSNIGDTVEVTIIRGGQEQMVIQATLGENILDNF